MFQLPAGYHDTKILKLSKEYRHPAKELTVMEGSIKPSSTIKVQRGPPDWVTGQWGMMTYTCQDATFSVHTRLPTLEGCLNDPTSPLVIPPVTRLTGGTSPTTGSCPTRHSSLFERRHGRDWQLRLRSGHRRSASMEQGRLGTSEPDPRRASGRAARSS